MAVVDQRTPTTRTQPVDRSLEASLARGAALRERFHTGELRAGPTPEHVARGLAEFFQLFAALFVDLGEQEPRRHSRWKRVAEVCEDAELKLRQATIRR